MARNDSEEAVEYQRASAPTKATDTPFAGRLGGNQSFVVDRNDEANVNLLARHPDAAPGMSLKDQFDLKQFRRLGLWKAAALEGMGTMFFVFITIWANISPPVLPTPPNAQFGYFNNAGYFGPLAGGLSNFILLTLFIFTFGTGTGAHLNPTITLGTFFARLCTLPRATLYVGFQLLGATIGGYFALAGYDSRNFKVGGCWLFPDVVPVKQAFAVEFITCLMFLYIAFGVGLDPRQQQVIPPSLSPFLIGMTLAVLGWVTGYSRYGYGGASLNPARCFGTFVGSRFPGWHWYHWVADICACVFHGISYSIASPGKELYK